MSKPTVAPTLVIFYKLNAHGQVNIEDLRDLDMQPTGIAPMVGDYVYNQTRSETPEIYQVMARHFDPEFSRVAVRVEAVDNVEACPFV